MPHCEYLVCYYPLTYSDPSGHYATCPEEKGGRCSNLVKKKTDPVTLTPWGRNMQSLYKAYRKEYGAAFTLTEFMVLVLSGEFNGIQNNENYEDGAFRETLGHAATHWFNIKCSANSPGGKCGEPSANTVYNWLGAMESGRRRYNEYIESGKLLGGVSATEDLARDVVSAIFSPPRSEWVRYEGNTWNGQWLPVNHEPYTWGNASLFTVLVTDYVFMIPGSDANSNWYIFSLVQSNYYGQFRRK